MIRRIAAIIAARSRQGAMLMVKRGATTSAYDKGAI